MSRHVLFTAVKNEAPFLLEWGDATFVQEFCATTQAERNGDDKSCAGVNLTDTGRRSSLSRSLSARALGSFTDVE